jgi:succinoglycan biosynthesis transport protein ExoP
MLKVNRRHSEEDAGGGVWGPSSSETLKNFTGMIRRQLPIFIVVITLTIGIGLVYLFTATPMFTAIASMVIDTRHVQLFQQQSVLSDIVVDAGTVQTQIELLKSQNVSLAVIKNEKLTEDPEFVGSGAGFVGALFNLFLGGGGEQKASEVQLARHALATFEGRRTVTRVGQSYVMEVTFQSADPEKAARIANDIVDSYIVDQLEAKYQATKRASLWLQDRLKELRTEASIAQKAVIDFKQKNNIIETGSAGSVGGSRLMSDQQLSEVESQRIMAQATTAEAKARYDRILEIMKQPIPDANVTDALKNEVIIKLRQQYLDLAQKQAIWAQRYGANHLATVSLRTQMLELRHAISDEMQKISESYKSDYEIAQARETSIKASLADAVSTTQTSNQAQVQLRELESSAQSYRSLYDNFLQRYMEAVQQQSFPITEARLISPAARPLSKSSPKTALILVLTLFLGAAASFGAAIIREMSDRVFRSSEQIEAELQVNCLAVLPKINGPQQVKRDLAKALFQPGQLMPSAKKTKARSEPIYGYVLKAPFSQFAEGLRTVKVAMDLSGLSRTKKVIGFTSTLPREGKSSIATNYAQLIAHSGSRVVLIDADLRNPTLSRYFGKGQDGLIHVLAGNKLVSDVLVVEESSGISVLPSGLDTKTPHTHELLASAAMKALVDDLLKRFDYVIIDLPPLLPVVDARATTAYVDSYIYVVEWGLMKIDAVRHALSSAPELYENLLGVVINKADMSVIRRYERYRSHYYNNKYYAQYGYTERENA